MPEPVDVQLYRTVRSAGVTLTLEIVLIPHPDKGTTSSQVQALLKQNGLESGRHFEVKGADPDTARIVLTGEGHQLFKQAMQSGEKAAIPGLQAARDRARARAPEWFDANGKPLHEPAVPPAVKELGQELRALARDHKIVAKTMVGDIPAVQIIAPTETLEELQKQMKGLNIKSTIRHSPSAGGQVLQIQGEALEALRKVAPIEIDAIHPPLLQRGVVVRSPKPALQPPVSEKTVIFPPATEGGSPGPAYSVDDTIVAGALGEESKALIRSLRATKEIEADRKLLKTGDHSGAGMDWREYMDASLRQTLRNMDGAGRIRNMTAHSLEGAEFPAIAISGTKTELQQLQWQLQNKGVTADITGGDKPVLLVQDAELVKLQQFAPLEIQAIHGPNAALLFADDTSPAASARRNMPSPDQTVMLSADSAKAKQAQQVLVTLSTLAKAEVPSVMDPADVEKAKTTLKNLHNHMVGSGERPPQTELDGAVRIMKVMEAQGALPKDTVKNYAAAAGVPDAPGGGKGGHGRGISVPDPLAPGGERRSRTAPGPVAGFDGVSVDADFVPLDPRLTGAGRGRSPVTVPLPPAPPGPVPPVAEPVLPPVAERAAPVTPPAPPDQPDVPKPPVTEPEPTGRKPGGVAGRDGSGAAGWLGLALGVKNMAEHWNQMSDKDKAMSATQNVTGAAASTSQTLGAAGSAAATGSKSPSFVTRLLGRVGAVGGPVGIVAGVEQIDKESAKTSDLERGAGQVQGAAGVALGTHATVSVATGSARGAGVAGAGNLGFIGFMAGDAIQKQFTGEGYVEAIGKTDNAITAMAQSNADLTRAMAAGNNVRAAVDLLVARKVATPEELSKMSNADIQKKLGELSKSLLDEAKQVYAKEVDPSTLLASAATAALAPGTPLLSPAARALGLPDYTAGARVIVGTLVDSGGTEAQLAAVQRFNDLAEQVNRVEMAVEQLQKDEKQYAAARTYAADKAYGAARATIVHHVDPKKFTDAEMAAEKKFLEDNPDVAKAVQEGRFKNGKEYFALAGFAEGRSYGGYSRADYARDRSPDMPQIPDPKRILEVTDAAIKQDADKVEARKENDAGRAAAAAAPAPAPGKQYETFNDYLKDKRAGQSPSPQDLRQSAQLLAGAMAGKPCEAVAADPSSGTSGQERVTITAPDKKGIDQLRIAADRLGVPVQFDPTDNTLTIDKKAFDAAVKEKGLDPPAAAKKDTPFAQLDAVIAAAVGINPGLAYLDLGNVAPPADGPGSSPVAATRLPGPSRGGASK